MPFVVINNNNMVIVPSVQETEIFHQTGKPENHRLKSADWDGICLFPGVSMFTNFGASMLLITYFKVRCT